MQKVFWANPYQQVLTTKIIKVDGNQVLPEKTIAYSFSGGQESDKAFINNLEVMNSRMEEGY
jgi:Ser-tRNA(Ala) deacylase AlaX